MQAFEKDNECKFFNILVIPSPIKQTNTTNTTNKQTQQTQQTNKQNKREKTYFGAFLTR
jgi:hypothetical protein